MRWLKERSDEAVRDALKEVAPELSEYSLELREAVNEGDPLWWSATATLGGRYVVKFAWSEPAALRLAHEVAVLGALTIPYLPEVVASNTDPVLLVTRLAPGKALFDVVDSLDRDQVGRQLAEFLSQLHTSRPSLGDLQPAALQPVSTEVLRARFPQWVLPAQRDTVLRWCDWADEALEVPRPSVLVHGDLHGGNQVWNDGRLQAVVDFETAGLAEPEYDLRAFPGTGPGVELLTATLHHYKRFTGQHLSVEHVMAWHLRTLLSDALWRSEAGVPLPDHRTPPDWIADLTTRFTALGIDA
jgi:aminoglycoside phosphotransferase (APT) family kinase protein